MLWPQHRSRRARPRLPRPGAAADRNPGRDGAVGVRIDAAALRELAAGMRDRPAAPGKGDPRPGRRGLQHQLAQAARPTSCSTSCSCPMARKTRGDGQPLDRHRRPGGDGRQAPHRPPRSSSSARSAKLKSTYADALPAADRSRPRAASTPPTTRRSRRPAGCPARTPTCRTSRPAARWARASGGPSSRSDGWLLLAADYSQIELRVLAHMSGDPGLVETFRRGARRPRGDRRPRLRGAGRAVPGRGAAAGQDHQLQRHLRHLGLFPGQAARDVDRRSPEVHRRYYEATYPGVKAFLDGEVERARPTGSSDDALRPQAPGARSCGPRTGDLAAGRPPHRPQHADPGNGGRPDEEGHDRRPARDRAAQACARG